MNRTEWLQWRRQGIGGSDIGALLGLSRYNSPWSLWADKMGLLPDDDTSERQQIGLDAEDFLGRVFTRRTGLHVANQQETVTHPHHQWARCTVDGYVFESTVADMRDLAIGTVQYKTDARRSWTGITDPITTPAGDKIPAAIEAQCQWEMGVTQQAQSWLVVGFAGWDVQVFELAFRPEDFAYMLEVAGRFWSEHVLTGQPPAPDGSDATADAIAAVWPQHAEGEAVAVDDLAELLVERGELKDLIADREKRVKAIDNTLKARLGDAEIGTVAGHPHITYRTVHRDAYTVPAGTYRKLLPVRAKTARRAA